MKEIRGRKQLRISVRRIVQECFNEALIKAVVAFKSNRTFLSSDPKFLCLFPLLNTYFLEIRSASFNNMTL